MYIYTYYHILVEKSLIYLKLHSIICIYTYDTGVNLSKQQKIDLSELKDGLPTIFSELYLSKVLKEKNVKPAGRKELFKKTLLLPIKWNLSPEFCFRSFDISNLTSLDILIALQPKYYVSHHTALYFHEITDQDPVNFYLSKEIKGRAPAHSNKFVPAKVRQVFLKDPRKTNNYFKFNKNLFYLIEKQDLKKIGVEKKVIGNKEIQLTSIERTLIDIVISPQYGGGIRTVISAFNNIDIDIDKLYEIYSKYDPFYPYWQSIGFLLNSCSRNKLENAWRKKFSIPKNDFYLDRGVRDDWEYNSDWKIYYPKGLI